MQTKSSHSAELLLALIIMSRATGYLFSKVCLRDMGVLCLLAERFLLAGILLCLLFCKKIHWQRMTLFRGALLGAIYFLCMVCELGSLKTTDTSTVSLLENTAIILVPVLELLLFRKKPTLIIAACAALALGGVFFLTYSGTALHFTAGELLSMGAAMCSACGIIVTGKFSRHDDGLSMGIFEVLFIGIFAAVVTILFRIPVTLPQSGGSWGSLLYLAVICTGFGYTLQPVVQKNVSTEKTGVFFSINPAFASLIGIVFLHEELTVYRLIGIALILAAILLSASSKKSGAV